MSSSIFYHPLTTFIAGVFVTLGLLAWLLKASAAPNQSAKAVSAYHEQLNKASNAGTVPEADEAAALKRFQDFLTRIDDEAFIREHALKVYAKDAWLDDTLVVHQGATAIRDYFLETAATVTSCEVKIDDVSKSGENHYVRWTMVFSAPAMSGGSPVHSVGISQVRFDREGKVVFHQDFWDSGQNFYAHLPVASGVVGYIQNRLK